MSNLKLRHVGVRPKGKVYQLETDFKVFREDLEDGGTRFWNARTLNSGCGNVLEKAKLKGNLIFCPFCGEMCNTNQFETVEQESEDEQRLQ